MEREWYAKNRDEINKRRHEAYKQNKNGATDINGLENKTHTQSAVSQGNDCRLW